jgi:hypothetical protein
VPPARRGGGRNGADAPAARRDRNSPRLSRTPRLPAAAGRARLGALHRRRLSRGAQ